MLGYVQKSRGAANYKAMFKGFSEDDQTKARKAYAQLKVSPEQGRIVINKSNLLKSTFSFYKSHFDPLPMELPRILFFMLRSGDYFPHSAFISRTGPSVDYKNSVLQAECLTHRGASLSAHRARCVDVVVTVSRQCRAPISLLAVGQPMHTPWLRLGYTHLLVPAASIVRASSVYTVAARTIVA